MDKSWMNKGRTTREYVEGVNEFLKFASKNVTNDGTVCCPCVKCVNYTRLTPGQVHDHLVYYGICKSYTH